MPPVLHPSQSKVDGLAFLGLSLARKSDQGHPASQTHQTAFDLNEVLDRDYEHIFSSNDDGWLVGGGEPPHSYKLAAPDSAHVEIMRIGTYEPQWGGVAQADIVNVLRSGQILIPNMVVVPTAVVANGDRPPELEIRFDMVDAGGTTATTTTGGSADNPLPVNWQLRFVHNQLFKYFQFPSRFCPGAFHSTILRKAEFRSKDHEAAYFAKCDAAVAKWREAGPQPLVALDRSGIEAVYCNNPRESTTTADTASSCAPLGPLLDLMGDLLTPTPTDDPTSGIYLFRDRNNITHYFAPNFRPDRPEKVQLVHQVLAERWDEASLSWQGVVANGGPSEGDVTPYASSSVVDEKEQTTEKGHADSGDVPKEKSQAAAIALVGPPKTMSMGNLLYKYKKLVATGGGSSGSSCTTTTTKTRPLPLAKERRHRGRPRGQRPVVFPSGGVKATTTSTTTTTTSTTTGLFKLRRTRHGIVEEIPAAAAE